MAVWLPKHENTLIVKLAMANLYDKRPYGGSVGGFLQIFAAPASRPAGVFAGIFCRAVLY